MNFNTFLLAVVIAVMGWVGYETVQAGKDVAVLKEKQTQIANSTQRLEVAVADANHGYDAKILAIEARLRQIDVELEKLRKQ